MNPFFIFQFPKQCCYYSDQWITSKAYLFHLLKTVFMCFSRSEDVIISFPGQLYQKLHAVNQTASEEVATYLKQGSWLTYLE